MQTVMPKKLTAALRSTYEGHKTAAREVGKAESLLQPNLELDAFKQHIFSTPEDYIKAVSIDEEMALSKFIEKIITLGSSQGFVAFMMLYQYMYDKKLLGQEIKELTGQEIIDHIYQDRSYKLRSHNKQAFLNTLIKLSGLKFSMEDPERTREIRKIPGQEEHYGFKHFCLIKVGGHDTEKDQRTITKLTNVSIMKDFIQIWYKKLSKLFIPLHDILKIPHDHNGDHKRGFNLSLALRHAELGHHKNYVEWNLEQCINIGQWVFDPEHKTRAWDKIIDSLEEGRKQELIDYKIIYKVRKPMTFRHIEKVVIYRLWQPAQNSRLNLHVNLEELKPKKKKPATIIYQLSSRASFESR
jgi:hypothetical protein